MLKILSRIGAIEKAGERCYSIIGLVYLMRDIIRMLIVLDKIFFIDLLFSLDYGTFCKYFIFSFS